MYYESPRRQPRMSHALHERILGLRMRSAAVGAPIGAEQLTFIYGDVAGRRHVRFVSNGGIFIV